MIVKDEVKAKVAWRCIKCRNPIGRRQKIICSINNTLLLKHLINSDQPLKTCQSFENLLAFKWKEEVSWSSDSELDIHEVTFTIAQVKWMSQHLRNLEIPVLGFVVDPSKEPHIGIITLKDLSEINGSNCVHDYLANFWRACLPYNGIVRAKD